MSNMDFFQDYFTTERFIAIINLSQLLDFACDRGYQRGPDFIAARFTHLNVDIFGGEHPAFVPVCPLFPFGWT